ncbi:hypothetical protein [Spirillospora albida]|uniref:hypothetical protein n=1 Tax=Spirillospora albida TaxID=58123 RepID=UPI0004C1636A|nr:hypothetical protein [Spirillospora albida]
MSHGEGRQPEFAGAQIRHLGLSHVDAAQLAKARAIPGTSSLAHLEENTAAAALELTPQDLADLAA